MEYIKVKNLKEGMIISKDVIDKDTILLTRNVRLTSNYIQSLKARDIDGVYIGDGTIAISESGKNEYVNLEFIDMVKEMRLNEKPINNQSITKKAINILKENNVNVESKDVNHSLQVAKLSMMIGASLKLSADDLYLLGMASLFHEVPEQGLSESIKTAIRERELTLKEKIMAKVFIKRSCSDLTNKGLPSEVKSIIEDYSLSVYCEDLIDNPGENYELSKIIKVSDMYDNLVVKNNLSPSNAVKVISSKSDNSSESIINELSRVTKTYPINALVKLNNGKIGKIVVSCKLDPSRPTVKVLDSFETINLKRVENEDIEIEEVYSNQ